MGEFYDALETRSDDARAADIAQRLPEQIARAQAMTGAQEALTAVAADTITSVSDLAGLPVLRKSELLQAQAAAPPFGGMVRGRPAHIFQSPGPIYEPGLRGGDWWRIGRFLHALGIGADDVVQNCFSYHFTPAGLIFDNAAEAVGAVVIPAGTGQTDLQVRAAADCGVTAYAGTPDYLKVILERADEMGESLAISKAAVGGGPLFPQLRAYYADRGITCRQNYATADVGNIAYESAAMEGMIVDEGILVEIVRPGTGDPVAEGEVGEVLVTTFTPDYPLIRFATGDMSAVLPGQSPCGRTNMRIKGWMGRADQTTKIKGMFVRPEQVAALVKSLAGIDRARVEVTRANDQDVMTVLLEGAGDAGESHSHAVREALKLGGDIKMVAPGSLPNDGKVIDDQRSFD